MSTGVWGEKKKKKKKKKNGGDDGGGGPGRKSGSRGGLTIERARGIIARRNKSFTVGFAALLGANLCFGLGQGALAMWAGYLLVGVSL